jgi:hypothetical protein
LPRQALAMAMRSTRAGWLEKSSRDQAGGSGSERPVKEKFRSSASAEAGSRVASSATQSASAS